MKHLKNKANLKVKIIGGAWKGRYISFVDKKMLDLQKIKFEKHYLIGLKMISKMLYVQIYFLEVEP